MKPKAPDYNELYKVKDQRFDVDNISGYTLCLAVGDTDFEFCIIDNEDDSCLMVEKFVFNTVFNPEQLITQLEFVYDDHHLLQAGFWHTIKLLVKNHKFSLIPHSLFDDKHLEYYLRLNCSVDKKHEMLFYNKQQNIEAVNIFSAESNVIDWFRNKYPSKKIDIIHASTSFTEGVVNRLPQNDQNNIFLDVEGGQVHILSFKGRNLEYSNIFHYTTAEDLTYYVMFVLNELSLNPEDTDVTVWGSVEDDSELVATLYKYIRNVYLGERPDYLKFGFVFDEINEQQFFSLFNLHFCK